MKKIVILIILMFLFSCTSSSSEEVRKAVVAGAFYTADEKDLAGVGALKEVVRRHKPDDEITMTVRRGDDDLDLKVKLGRREYRPRPRILIP